MTVGGLSRRRIGTSLTSIVVAFALLVGLSVSAGVAQATPGGEYTITGVPSGSYKVEFFATSLAGNYLSQFYNGKATFATGNLVAVTAPNTTPGINAALQTGGQIAGKVTAASGGAALANVSVCATQTGVSEPAFKCGLTAASGEYTLAGLPSGTYSVTFETFEGSFLSQQRSGVPVTVGTTTSGINAALQSAAAGGQISGTVTETGHTGIPNVQVCADEVGGEFFIACATTNASGEYTVIGMPTGSFDISFTPAENSNFIRHTQTTPVGVVSGATTPNGETTLEKGGQIDGTVTAMTGGLAIGGVEVCAFETGGESIESCAMSAANGTYTVLGLSTGSYDVSFTPPTGSNFLPHREASVAVTTGVAKGPINAALVTGGQVSGRVTAAVGGAPLASAFVCASPTSAIEETFGCAAANANGEYVIPGLATGTYNVSFNPLEGTDFLAQTDAGVGVTEGTTTPLNAALSPGGQITGQVTAASGGATLGNVLVCAVGSESFFGCSTTNAGHPATPIPAGFLPPTPNSNFSQKKAPVFNAKTGDLEFFFTVANAGKFTWSLSFKNSDVAFADSLGLGLGDDLAFAPPLTEAAKKKGKKSKKCKAGFTKHAGKCVHILVPFGSGSKTVSAGAVEITVHASAKALKALEGGHTLHVSGTFKFQSALGGAGITHTESAIVHPPKKPKKGKNKHH